MLTILLLTLIFPDDQPQLLAKFVGDWTLIETIRDGKVQEEPVGGKTIFSFKADGTYLGLVGDSVIGKGTYRPLPGANPAAIDWTAAGRSEFDRKFTKEYRSAGIYQFEKNTLVIALKQTNKAIERPTDFTGKGTDVFVLKFKRGK